MVRHNAIQKTKADQGDAAYSPEFLELAPRDELKKRISLIVRDVNR